MNTPIWVVHGSTIPHLQLSSLFTGGLPGDEKLWKFDWLYHLRLNIRNVPTAFSQSSIRPQPRSIVIRQKVFRELEMFDKYLPLNLQNVEHQFAGQYGQLDSNRRRRRRFATKVEKISGHKTASARVQTRRCAPYCQEGPRDGNRSRSPAAGTVECRQVGDRLVPSAPKASIGRFRTAADRRRLLPTGCLAFQPGGSRRTAWTNDPPTGRPDRGQWAGSHGGRHGQRAAYRSFTCPARASLEAHTLGSARRVGKKRHRMSDFLRPRVRALARTPVLEDTTLHKAPLCVSNGTGGGDSTNRGRFDAFSRRPSPVDREKVAPRPPQLQRSRHIAAGEMHQQGPACTSAASAYAGRLRRRRRLMLQRRCRRASAKM